VRWLNWAAHYVMTTRSRFAQFGKEGGWSPDSIPDLCHPLAIQSPFQSGQGAR
jgi:hypothetical protein